MLLKEINSTRRREIVQAEKTIRLKNGLKAKVELYTTYMGDELIETGLALKWGSNFDFFVFVEGEIDPTDYIKILNVASKKIENCDWDLSLDNGKIGKRIPAKESEKFDHMMVELLKDFEQ